ncbi:MAG: flagellar basal body-associated protein FliL [Desulfovibrio sp.]
MVFMVPDEPDERLETPGNGTADSAATPKAKLDDTEVSRASQKVDLDLDDAPFLEEEEEEEEILAEEPFPAQPEPEAKPKRQAPAWLRSKMLIVGVAVVLLLGIAAYFFFSGSGEPHPPVVERPAEPAPVAMPEPQPDKTAQEETAPAEVPAGESLVRLDPFLIEQRDTGGKVRFLEVSLVFSTPDPALASNLTRETPTVRYALFYYLKNKDLQFLTDEKNTENLKKELLSVVNQYMAAGRFETILFEDYLVR